MATDKSDLRSTARDAQRAASHKAKWAHGVATHPAGRDVSKPRPLRVSDLPRCGTRVSGSGSNKAASATRVDIAAATAEWPCLLSSSPGAHSSSSSSDEDEEQAAIRMVREYEAADEVYGAAEDSAPPRSGSQVLHGALNKAIERYEDKETVKLVRSEWAMLDEGGEEVGLTPSAKKGKGKHVNQEQLLGGAFEMV